MKIDSTDFGVVEVEVTYKEALEWLAGDAEELVEVNSAIDEAASHAGTYGTSFILIKIVKGE